MLVYHYPGLEFIHARSAHWELAIDEKRMKVLFPELERWPPPLIEARQYVLEREMITTSLGIKGFIHCWYWQKEAPLWDETAREICDDNSARVPIALLWCWKLPHLRPLNRCIPYAITYRSPKRETLGDATDLERAVNYLVDHYLRSKNYLRIFGRPALFLYHIEGWNVSFSGMYGGVFRALQANFLKCDIDPYIIGVSVGQPEHLDAKCLEGLDALGRYNDLPNFLSGDMTQDYMENAERCSNLWEKIAARLHTLNIAFFPSVSLGWNASPRFAQASSSTSYDYGYPLSPIVTTPHPQQVEYFINLAKSFSSNQANSFYTVCAWNEWTENAALEYFIRQRIS